MATIALTEATSLTLASVDGSSVLQLQARALPYRPITIGGKQRMEFTWYPGSPSATVQMLGPEEAPIELKGFWKDRFLGLQPLESTAGDRAAAYNGEYIATVSDLVEIVDQMRRSGLVYRFSWDRLQRFGHIANFEVTWHNTHDAEWLLEFAVTAQEERAQVLPQVNYAAPVSIATDLQRLDSYYKSVLDPESDVRLDRLIPPSVLFLQDFLAGLEELQDQITAYTNDALRIATNITSAVTAFPDAARGLAATMSQSLRSISNTATALTDEAVGTYFFFAGGQDNSPIGSQVAATNAQQQLAQFIRGLQQTTVFGRYDLQRQLQQQQTRSFLATGNMDLRDISTQFYGTPDNWIDLMRYNGYEDSKVQAGALIWIPPEPRSGPLGSGGDY